ncbi:MAG: rhomboid family intramembrane serine protease [Acidobacteriia bacterium]|nr:rhomboid family intramembrane serine protease [Terriglobia bacterium]
MPRPRFPLRRSVIYGYFPTGVKWLLISNTAIFLLFYLGGAPVQSNMLLLALTPSLVVHNFFVFELFTYMFLHGGFGHLLFNMLTLWMFGTPLEQTWGTRAFLKYYFLCGVGAGVCDTAVNLILGHKTTTIGASGAIYGLLLAFGVLFPDVRVLMNFLFPIKAKYLVMIYGAIALFSALGSGNSGVSNVAHLGGMAFGYIYLKARLPKTRLRLPDAAGWYRQWKLRRAKKKFQVYLRKHGGPGPRVN